MSELFRREVIENRKTAALGDVLIINPPSFAILSIAVCVIVTALVLFLGWGQFARKETAHGYLVPDKGLVKIMPPFAGTVMERHVDEGEEVNAGDLLFVVRGNRSTRNTRDIDAAIIAEARNQRRSLFEQLEQTRRASTLETAMLEREVASLEDELAKAEEESDAQKRRREISANSLETVRGLVADGHLPRQRLLDHEREHLALDALVSSLERNRLSLIRRLDAARSQIDVTAIETATLVADYEGRIAEMEQRLAELEARAGYAVRAPVAGIATNVILEPGQTVTGDAPLLALLPDGSRLEALIYIPTRAAGLVVPGSEVLVRYDAFPYQRFGLQSGIIQRISNSVLTPGETDTPVRFSEPVYTAVVTLERQYVPAYGEEIPLKPGMLIQADIVLERQSLLRWLLDPLYAATGHL